MIVRRASASITACAATILARLAVVASRTWAIQSCTMRPPRAAAVARARTQHIVSLRAIAHVQDTAACTCARLAHRCPRHSGIGTSVAGSARAWSGRVRRIVGTSPMNNGAANGRWCAPSYARIGGRTRRRTWGLMHASTRATRIGLRRSVGRRGASRRRRWHRGEHPGRDVIPFGRNAAIIP
jgi:hypothetical protein